MADKIFSEKYITVFRHNPCSVIRQYVVLFCVRDCFYVYMGNKICEIDECILF